MADKYFPDTKEPHLHFHKNGITFASDKGHAHKDVSTNAGFLENNCFHLIEDLKKGTDREKKIAEEIKKLLREGRGRLNDKKAK